MKIPTVVASALVAAWFALIAVLAVIGGSTEGGVAAIPTLATLAMVLVGAVVAIRRPRNPLGWMFCVAGLGFLGEGVSISYAKHALVIAPDSLPAGVWVAWISTWIEFPVSGLVPYLLLLFPTGRLRSPRWRPVAWLAAISFGALWFAAAVRPGPLSAGSRASSSYEMVPASNPFGWPAFAGAVEMADAIGPRLVLLTLAAAMLALFLRFRAARGEERQQLKWFLYAALTSVVAVVGTVTVSRWLPEPVASTVRFGTFGLAMVAFPVGMGIALLRYRLYDIDVLINRTLVYGALTATLGATYFAAVVVLGSALRPLTGGSEIAVAISTLAVVGLFAPLRRRIQGTVDRRFYRSRYDAQRTLDGFGVRLRNEVALDEVRADLLIVVSDTLRPAHVSLWLREAPR